MAALTLP
jgi:hypothetical protein